MAARSSARLMMTVAVAGPSRASKRWASAAVATVSARLVLAVPFALWGAWRFLGLLGRLVSPRGLPRWVLLWGATTYALVPATSGAWGQGRLGVVVAAAVVTVWTANGQMSEQ